MGAVFDAINAEVAAREGLIAAAGVGQLHLIPAKDRSRITQRTRSIRAIRCQAAAALGVLPAFDLYVPRLDADFRVEFHRPNSGPGRAFINAKGCHQTYIQATNLSTGKVHVWNGARKERLQCGNMPTGVRTARVIGTDENGEPLFEIDENPLAAALEHFRHAALLGITEEVATDATPEWGNTTTVVYPDVDGAVKEAPGESPWATIRGGPGTNAFTSNASYILADIVSGAASADYLDFVRAIHIFDTSAVGTDTISSATFHFKTTTTAATTGVGDSTVDLVASAPASTSAIVAGDYDSLGTTVFGQLASIAALSTSTGYDIVMNASGIAAVDGSGFTTLGVRIGMDTTNSEPAWPGAYVATRVYAYFLEQAGTADDPKLTIEHAAAAAASGGSLLSGPLGHALGLI